MDSFGWLSLAALLALVAAWPYTQRVRHAAVSPVAAYVIFVVTFAAMASVLFGMITDLLRSTGSSAILRHPIGAIGVTAVPGFLLASWLIQRRPRRAPLPGE